MPRVNPSDATLKGLLGVGAIVVSDGIAMLRVVALDEKGEDTISAINLSDLIGVCKTSVTKLINSKDKVSAAKSKYRKDSETAYKLGAITAEQFDAIFGAGESAKVNVTPTPPTGNAATS